ncbi:MAG: cytochrome C [Verrucomicrobia bacterium]|nr:cytochrome C [Verrucomicrobiota bacterium]
MAQIFPRAYNTLAPAVLVGASVLLGLLGVCVYAVFWSPYMTHVQVPITQPVPFSHQHHVGGLGIDCRYCHTGVETESFAGMPPTHTCMTCHSQLWTEAPVLAQVRQSLTSGAPIGWNRVHNVPDFVYFNHSIHVSKGVGCVSCHGRVDQMPLMWKAQSLYMKWCLDCHRHPETAIRDLKQVFDPGSPNPSREDAGERMQEYQVRPARFLLDCSNCHR